MVFLVLYVFAAGASCALTLKDLLEDDSPDAPEAAIEWVFWVVVVLVITFFWPIRVGFAIRDELYRRRLQRLLDQRFKAADGGARKGADSK
jgi:hypothetical protein